MLICSMILSVGVVQYDDGELPDEVPAFEVLANFAALTEDEKLGLRGSVAIAYSTYGAGSVLCISPHPESTFDWGPTRRKQGGVKKDEGTVGNETSIPRQRRIVQRAILLLTTKANANK